MARKNSRLKITKNEEGAIDLASIMVGIIVIGLVGGVIAATVFAIIPWAQDNAAKQQLDSVVAAQSAYKGLSSSVPPAIPAGYPVNSYGDSAILASVDLLQEDSNAYCVVATSEGVGYQAFAKSAAGTYWQVASENTKPRLASTYELPRACDSLRPPFDDPSTRLTQLTYKCDIATTIDLPFVSRISEGTATWSDGLEMPVPAGSGTTSRNLESGKTYSLSYEGTYQMLSYLNLSGAECLRSMDHWGNDVGTTSAMGAFYNANNLINVPTSIPSTITDISFMFSKATSFNDSDISKWEVSNVTDMTDLFHSASVFNQPLKNWNMSNVTSTMQMFARASQFDQPVNGWDVSSVTNMGDMFAYAFMFDQPLDEWDVSKVTIMSDMFYQAFRFDHSINDWDVSNVTDLSRMFYTAYAFNQPLDKWDVSKVIDMHQMFDRANKFNRDISNWKTTSLVNGTTFASPILPDAYMPSGTSR